MIRIAPFRGIIYNPKKIRDFSKVVAPPYDVISPEEQERLYRKSPQNVVRLILNREPNPYEEAARTFEQWLADGILVRGGRPAIYFLSQRFTLKSGEEKERLGFMALARIEDPSSGGIHPHEKTHKGPLEDRIKVMHACQANLSSIFTLYSQPKQTITQMLEEHVRGNPPTIQVQVKDEGKGSSLLWEVTDDEIIGSLQRQMEDQPLLIADGHHRYEAATRYRDRLRSERVQWTGREGFNYVMMFFANMTEEGLVILPTHRLLREFPRIPFLQLEEAMQGHFHIEQYPKTPEGRRSFLKDFQRGGKKRHLIGASFKGDPRYLILRLKNKRSMQRLGKEMSESLLELDVTILHHLLIENILGLSPEAQAQAGNISYGQDTEDTLNAVEMGASQAAFILNPLQSEQILAVAMGGEKMPQKSTYFYPKLLSGLVINKIDLDEEIPN